PGKARPWRPSTSKLQRAGMPDGSSARLSRPSRPDLTESRFHLVDEKVDNVRRPFASQRTQAPQKSFACECSLRSERDRTHHVQPGTNAAVQHHRRAGADSAAYSRE